MSLYAAYIAEREGKEIVEDQHGFATFSQLNDLLYIEDIFVVAEQRKNGYAAKYADQIAEIAKERGLKGLLGSVKPSAKGSTESLKILLAYGFRLHSSEQNAIFFVKELSNG